MKFFGSMVNINNHGNSKKDSKRALLFIASYIKRYIPRIIPGILCLIAVDLIQILIPNIVQRIIDLLSDESFSISVINRYTIIIIGLAIGMVFIRFLWRIFIIGAARRIERDLRDDMFRHLESLSFTFFNSSNTGSLMALMTNDVNAVRMAAGPTLIGLTDIFFIGVLALIFMFRISIKLTLMVVSPLPLIVFIMVKFGPEIVKRYKKVQASFANISKASQDAFSGIRVIKGYNVEKIELQRFEEECNKYVDANISFVKLWGLFFPMVAFLASLSLAILMYAGGKSVILGSLTFGEFLSFSMYINLIIWPVAAIGWVFSILQRGIASASRIINLMDNKTELEEISEKIPDSRVTSGNKSGLKFAISSFQGNIKYENIYFRYSKNKDFILNNLSLNIPEGSKYGIIGKPGSGKSTLLYLIFKLFPIEDGDIYIDGINIKNIPVSLIRKRVALAPQAPFLFSDTIYNNIIFGTTNLGREDVEELAKAIHIYDEIMEFKDGFETTIGERGVTLSGGQLQRISLARALAINPDLLVMDDALSQVDSSKELGILENVFNRMKGKTIIVASNRISTLVKCDKISVINRGRILEEGTHEELIKKNGYYSKIYELQRFEGEI